MGDKSKIEWTDATWNPLAGCSPVSPGCTHCYAATMAKRLAAMGQEKYAGTAERRGKVDVFTGVLRLGDDEEIERPLRWTKPRRIFVNSMSDLFHEGAPDSVITHLFAIMALAQRHTFQVLTKRPERMAEYLRNPERQKLMAAMVRLLGTRLRTDDGNFRRHANHYSTVARALESGEWPGCGTAAWPLDNVWLGTSVEDQERADERIPWLLKTPAAVRFLSCEPLLGPVNIRGHLMDGFNPGECARCKRMHGFTRCPNYGRISKHRTDVGNDYCEAFERKYFAIDWVIAGGESGPRARPVHPDWVRSLRDQCQAAAVPFFFKQWGEWAPPDAWLGPLSPGTDIDPVLNVARVGKKRAGRMLDRLEWNEFPIHHGDTEARRG